MAHRRRVDRAGPLRGAAGFTLIEVLVSFAIAALVLGVLYRAYSGGLQASLTAERYRGAILLAQSTLDELAATPPAAATEDRVGIYDRSWTITNHPELLPASTQMAAMPYTIAVTIAWREGRREREVSLSVLRLAAVAP